MAGPSIDGMQTRTIALAHLDAFSHLGIFSGGSISTADVPGIGVFKQKAKRVFASYGSLETASPTLGASTAAPTIPPRRGHNSDHYARLLFKEEWDEAGQREIPKKADRCYGSRQVPTVPPEASVATPRRISMPSGRRASTRASAAPAS